MKSFYKITLLIAVVALMSACHSTEANYKESYDKAVAASRTGEKGEKYWQDIKVRSQNNYVVDGDSIRLVRNFFNIVTTAVFIAFAFVASSCRIFPFGF